MDDPSLGRSEHLKALKVLARLNRLSRTAPSLAEEMRSRWDFDRRKPLRILDLACGGGDIVFSLERMSKGSGTKHQIDGCDVSPVAVDFANSKAGQIGSGARFFCLDVLRDPLPRGYDLFVSSLFIHHLTKEEAVSLLRQMSESAGTGFLINDLLRSRTGYLLAYLASRTLTRSPVVRKDSLLSVRSALTMSELNAYMVEASLSSGMKISRRFPLRLVCSWGRS